MKSKLDQFPIISGRMNRKDYWCCMIGSFIGMAFYGAIVDKLNLGDWAIYFFIFTFVYALFWSSFMRARDIGLWGISGIIPPMPLLLLFIPGDKSENAYGLPFDDTDYEIEEQSPTNEISSISRDSDGHLQDKNDKLKT